MPYGITVSNDRKGARTRPCIWPRVCCSRNAWENPRVPSSSPTVCWEQNVIQCHRKRQQNGGTKGPDRHLCVTRELLQEITERNWMDTTKPKWGWRVDERNEYKRISDVVIDDKHGLRNRQNRVVGETSLINDRSLLEIEGRGLQNVLFCNYNDGIPDSQLVRILKNINFRDAEKDWWFECQIQVLWLSFPRDNLDCFTSQ